MRREIAIGGREAEKRNKNKAIQLSQVQRPASQQSDQPDDNQVDSYDVTNRIITARRSKSRIVETGYQGHW